MTAEQEWMRPLSASLRRRIRRRRVVRVLIPVVSPYSDRLRERALEGHSCQVIRVRPGERR